MKEVSFHFNKVEKVEDDTIYVNVFYQKVKRFLFWKYVKDYHEIFVMTKDDAITFSEKLAKATKGIVSLKDELKFLSNI